MTTSCIGCGAKLNSDWSRHRHKHSKGWWERFLNSRCQALMDDARIFGKIQPNWVETLGSNSGKFSGTYRKIVTDSTIREFEAVYLWRIGEVLTRLE